MWATTSAFSGMPVAMFIGLTVTVGPVLTVPPFVQK